MSTFARIASAALVVAALVAAGSLAAGAAQAQSITVQQRVNELIGNHQSKENKDVLLSYKTKVTSFLLNKGIAGKPIVLNSGAFHFEALYLTLRYYDGPGAANERGLICDDILCLIK